jgi:quinol monooxygenase YgiN
MPDPAGATPGEPIIALIEWQAPSLGPAEARRLAAETAAAFSSVPGLREIRFFGDFETGRHFYFQRWESRAALDAYMASESMFRNRKIAEPFVEGPVTRRLFSDYSPPSNL